MRGTAIGEGLWQGLTVLHRYLGIAAGPLMLIWFLSGIVMMYVGFPQPLGAERLLRTGATVTESLFCL